MKKDFLFAVATLVGTIIGAGIFGLPYVVEKIGFFPGLFYLLVLGGIILIVHLCYGEIVLRTKEDHVLPGYVKIYLGPKTEKLTFLNDIAGLSGCLLIYLILIGQFFQIIFGNFLGGNAFQWTIVFFILSSIAILKGLKIVPRLEFLISLTVLVIILVIFCLGAPLIKTENLKEFNPSYLFFPFGTFLFAFGGSSSIPLIERILEKDKKKMKKAIIWGSLFPIFVYFLFILVFIGIAGENISENAINNLKDFFGEKVLFLGALLGALTVISSYLTIALNLKKVYQWDLKLNKTLSCGLAIFVPLIFFILGFRNFVEIIGIIGAFCGGIAGILVILCFIRAKKLSQEKPAYQINLPNFISYSIIAIFFLVIIWQIIELIF